MIDVFCKLFVLAAGDVFHAGKQKSVKFPSSINAATPKNWLVCFIVYLFLLVFGLAKVTSTASF